MIERYSSRQASRLQPHGPHQSDKTQSLSIGQGAGTFLLFTKAEFNEGLAELVQLDDKLTDQVGSGTIMNELNCSL